MTTPRTTSDRSADALPTSWRQLLALSGIAFAVRVAGRDPISGTSVPDAESRPRCLAVGHA
jgi:hypothetical protein